VTLADGSVTLLTDGQVAAVCTTLSGAATCIALAFRWAILRVCKSMDDSTAARVDSTKVLGELKSKVEDVHGVATGRTPLAHAATLPAVR
jgi:hypothetical protein